MDNELIKLALSEIAESLDDSYEKPVSLALILGQIGANSRTFKDILIQTRVKLINETSVDIQNMSIADFRSFFKYIDTHFERVNDETILAVLNYLAKSYIEELTDVSKKLTTEFKNN